MLTYTFWQDCPTQCFTSSAKFSTYIQSHKSLPDHFEKPKRQRKHSLFCRTSTQVSSSRSQHYYCSTNPAHRQALPQLWQQPHFPLLVQHFIQVSCLYCCLLICSNPSFFCWVLSFHGVPLSLRLVCISSMERLVATQNTQDKQKWQPIHTLLMLTTWSKQCGAGSSKVISFSSSK